MSDEDDRRTKLFGVVEKFNSTLREAEGYETAFTSVIEDLRLMAGADFAAVTLMEDDGLHLRLVAASGVVPIPIATLDNYKIDTSLWKDMSNANRAGIVRWRSVSEMPDQVRALAERFGIADLLVCSIIMRRTMLGLLVVANTARSPELSMEIEQDLTILADHIALGVDDLRSVMLFRQNQEETQRVLSLAPIGIMWLNPRGIILSLNKQFLRVLDTPREEDLIGTSAFEITAVNQSGLDALIMQCMDGHAGEKVDLHMVPKPDRAFYLHVKATPIESESGEIQGIVLVAMDTTSKVRLESQLERSYEKLTQTYQELERVTKMKSQFIDVVSHELRTPLTVMRGYVDLVDSEYSPKMDKKFQQKLKTIKANTDKLYALVESMIDVSRLEKGTLEIHPEPVKIDTILQELSEARMKDAEDKRQSLSFGIDGPIPIIKADRRRMKDVFNNLIDNAIKYTEEGGKIQVGVRDEGRIVHVWVKDNGIGIPLENLGKIFDRFYIVAKDDLAHQVDRIGLSLPIAKGIVESHGGRLWVESQVGKGSVFHVDLPKEQAK